MVKLPVNWSSLCGDISFATFRPKVRRWNGSRPNGSRRTGTNLLMFTSWDFNGHSCEQRNLVLSHQVIFAHPGVLDQYKARYKTDLYFHPLRLQLVYMNPFPLLKRKAWYTHRELMSSKGMHLSKNMYLIFLGIPATGCVQHYNCMQVASKGVKLFLHLVLYWSGTRGMTWCASVCLQEWPTWDM